MLYNQLENAYGYSVCVGGKGGSWDNVKSYLDD